MPSFRTWLESRPDEVPAAAGLALAIARSGAAGVSVEELRGLLGISPETLRDLLAELVRSGQVVILRVGGRMVYRAVM
jgi:predicted transcriptional regulator